MILWYIFSYVICWFKKNTNSSGYFGRKLMSGTNIANKKVIGLVSGNGGGKHPLQNAFYLIPEQLTGLVK